MPRLLSGEPSEKGSVIPVCRQAGFFGVLFWLLFCRSAAEIPMNVVISGGNSKKVTKPAAGDEVFNQNNFSLYNNNTCYSFLSIPRPLFVAYETIVHYVPAGKMRKCHKKCQLMPAFEYG
jgi:hypothetical protein